VRSSCDGVMSAGLGVSGGPRGQCSPGQTPPFSPWKDTGLSDVVPSGGAQKLGALCSFALAFKLKA
jgi:hypothetical protein